MKNRLFSILGALGLCFLTISSVSAQKFSGYIFRVGLNASATKVNNFTYSDNLIFLPNGTQERSIGNFASASATTFAIPVGVEIFGKNIYFNGEASFGLRGSIQPNTNYNKSISKDGTFDLRLAFGGYFNEEMGIMGGIHYKYQSLKSPNFTSDNGANGGVRGAGFLFEQGTNNPNNQGGNLFNDRIGGNMPGVNINYFYSPNSKVMIRGTYLISYIVPAAKFPTRGLGHQIEGSICYVTSEDSDERFGLILTAGFQSRGMWSASAVDAQSNLPKYDYPKTAANSLFANLSIILPGKILNGLGRVASYGMYIW